MRVSRLYRDLRLWSIGGGADEVKYTYCDAGADATEWRYQNFDRNRYLDFFSDTKFSETDTETLFPIPNFPKPKLIPSKNWQKFRNREVSKPKCQSLADADGIYICWCWCKRGDICIYVLMLMLMRWKLSIKIYVSAYLSALSEFDCGFVSSWSCMRKMWNRICNV